MTPPSGGLFDCDDNTAIVSNGAAHPPGFQLP